MGLTKLPSWNALKRHYDEMKNVHMRDLFASDSQRFHKYSLVLNDVLFDYSKNIVTDETMSLLIDLAEENGVPAAIRSMFRGDKINVTENRPALHVALRNRSNRPIYIDGDDVMPQVNAVLNRMRRFSDAVRTGSWVGYTGKPVRDVVNIGIGGSDLGPRMVTYALQPFARDDLNVHYVSNVDPSNLSRVLRRLNPETTLFLVASKTFTTQETMANAAAARRWLLHGARDDRSAVAKHFVAMSTNYREVKKFGIDENNVFPFWDWVGGRYSLWSSIGLSIALYVGMDHFEDLLLGAHEADEHFRSAPLRENIPVIMGLLGIWYNNFWHAQSHAIVPYDDYLRYFPDYFQQGDMESNGKRVTRNGKKVDYETGPIIWGQTGTNGQHAFFQLLHQGTKLVPCDFIAASRSHHPLGEQHDMLIANFLAQTEALMKGRSPEETRELLKSQGLQDETLQALSIAKSFPGNKPSNSFLLKRLTPQTLGTLIALYEHKIFVQGIVWNINSFDQMGVELGKQLAECILQELPKPDRTPTRDSSTEGLIHAYRAWCQ